MAEAIKIKHASKLNGEEPLIELSDGRTVEPLRGLLLNALHAVLMPESYKGA